MHIPEGLDLKLACAPFVATKAKQISFRGHDAQRPRSDANSKAVAAFVVLIVNVRFVDDI